MLSNCIKREYSPLVIVIVKIFMGIMLLVIGFFIALLIPRLIYSSEIKRDNEIAISEFNNIKENDILYILKNGKEVLELNNPKLKKAFIDCIRNLENVRLNHPYPIADFSVILSNGYNWGINIEYAEMDKASIAILTINVSHEHLSNETIGYYNSEKLTDFIRDIDKTN